MAMTLKGTMASAKNNIFGKAALRYVSFITAFIGVLFIVLHTDVTKTLITLLGVAFLLIGVLLCSGNFKILISDQKEKKKEAGLYLFVGVVLIVVGVLLLIYGNQISSYINLVIGILIGIYGLVVLVKYLIDVIKSKGKKAWPIINLVFSILLLTSGVLIAILFSPKVGTNSTYFVVVEIFATVTGGIGMLLY